MLLYPERLDDEESGFAIALACFGHRVLGGHKDLPPLAAVHVYPGDCRSEPRPGQALTTPTGAHGSSTPRVRAVSRVIALVALAVLLTFWLARAPSAWPVIQEGANAAPPDLATLALDAVPVVADW